MFLRLFSFSIVVAFIFTPGVIVNAGEIVRFQSAPIPHSPFKVKRAKAKGIVLLPKSGIELKGVLSRPGLSGTRPAVVLLVSGDGLQDSHLAWAEKLAEWGYVGLVVDSFGSRGGTDYRDTQAVDVSADAYNAYAFLDGLEFVDGRKIAVLGFSLGGSYLFKILDRLDSTRPNNVQFKLGIAFYPNCDLGKQYIAPILILAGDSDSLMSLQACRDAFLEATARGNQISLKVYPGATHFFDNPNYQKIPSARDNAGALPLWFESNHYDEEAHRDAMSRVKEFLDRHLQKS